MEQQFPDNEIETSQPFNLKESPGSIRLLIEEADLTVAMEPSNLIVSSPIIILYNTIHHLLFNNICTDFCQRCGFHD